MGNTTSCSKSAINSQKSFGIAKNFCEFIADFSAQIFRSKILNRLLALWLICLMMTSSCSRPFCRQWEFQENASQICGFSAGRLILSPDSDYTHLELEVLRTSSGVRFYINLLFLQALPISSDVPQRTQISIQFQEEDPWIVYPYLMEGGQRLLLPGDVADCLLKSLSEEKTFTIRVGRNQITVIPANFIKSYSLLRRSP